MLQLNHLITFYQYKERRIRYRNEQKATMWTKLTLMRTTSTLMYTTPEETTEQRFMISTTRIDVHNFLSHQQSNFGIPYPLTHQRFNNLCN